MKNSYKQVHFQAERYFDFVGKVSVKTTWTNASSKTTKTKKKLQQMRQLCKWWELI